MPVPNAWQELAPGAKKAPSAASSTKKIDSVRRSSSRNSINFDISKSPDAASVLLERELGDITLEDQARADVRRPFSRLLFPSLRRRLDFATVPPV